MRSLQITAFGPSTNLKVVETPSPDTPVSNQIQIDVKAAGVNRADILQRKGFYPAPKGYPEKIPGLEFAGDVSATGPDCVRFKKGDRVMGITAGGAQSEEIVVDERHAVLIPQSLSYTDAAAIPEVFITAHDAVWIQGKLERDETLLIHAVGSGVGLAALQIAQASGNEVIGTSRTSQKLDKIEGLDLEICTSTPTSETQANTLFSERVREFGGADVVLDLVGGAYLDENLKSLNLKGRLVAVGLVGGRKAELDLGLVLAKRIKLIGTVLRSRSSDGKAAAVSAFERDILPLFENGVLKSNLDRVFDLEDAAAAHDYVESNESFGKVVLSVSG